MAVGDTITESTLNQNLSGLAIQLRNVMQQVSNLSRGINGQGNGLATLEAIGYSAGDAAAVIQLVAYMNTVAGIYFGTATQATEFDFNNALSQLWAGQ